VSVNSDEGHTLRTGGAGIVSCQPRFLSTGSGVRTRHTIVVKRHACPASPCNLNRSWGRHCNEDTREPPPASRTVRSRYAPHKESTTKPAARRGPSGVAREHHPADLPSNDTQPNQAQSCSGKEQGRSGGRRPLITRWGEAVPSGGAAALRGSLQLSDWRTRPGQLRGQHQVFFFRRPSRAAGVEPSGGGAGGREPAMGLTPSRAGRLATHGSAHLLRWQAHGRPQPLFSPHTSRAAARPI